MRRAKGERLSCEEVLELAWGRLADAARSDPAVIEALERRTARLLDDPGELGLLSDGEAEWIARLAHVAMGELLVRTCGGGGEAARVHP